MSTPRAKSRASKEATWIPSKGASRHSASQSASSGIGVKRNAA